VEVFRRGDEIVLREKVKGLARAFEILANLPDDFLPEGRHDTPPHERNGIRPPTTKASFGASRG
jgi:antitoxin VapB